MTNPENNERRMETDRRSGRDRRRMNSPRYSGVERRIYTDCRNSNEDRRDENGLWVEYLAP